MNKSFISRLWKYLRFYRKQIIFSLILAAISVGANLALPVFFGKAIDLIAGEGKVDFSPMAGIFLAVSGLVLAAAVSDFIAQILYAKVADGVTKRVRDDAFKSVEKVPISYIDGRSTGEILSVEIGDADKMSDGLLMGFSRFFSGILTIAGTLVFMFAINWVIASVVAAITPLSLFASKFITGRSYSTFKKQAVATGKTTALTDETLTNLAAIKASSSEEYFTDKFDELNAELKTTSFKASFFSSLVNPTTRFVNAVIYAAVAFSGAMLSVGGVMAVTAGTLIALLSYANRYTKPFNEISSVIAELSGAKACAERLFELIDEKSEEDGTLPLPSRVSGEVVAEKVYFSYDEARPLIRDFSLSVKEGQKVAIVGPTGCGKTTLINLLLRFYDTNSGKISVDGIAVNDLKREQLRSAYGMVLQDAWIRNATVRDNIKIGKKDATDEEVERAAKLARAHQFIIRLPKGYDTVIGEEGLSQGQKQLICIARVMLRLPPILILDEATSNIDTRTEIKIQEGFEVLTQGKTTFTVAHRLSTIRKADLILVMNEGNVVEKGTHTELLERKGFYYNLYNSQFEK